jgi:hypothetical protein
VKPLSQDGNYAQNAAQFMVVMPEKEARDFGFRQPTALETKLASAAKTGSPVGKFLPVFGAVGRPGNIRDARRVFSEVACGR